jgi:hypothetical protein
MIIIVFHASGVLDLRTTTTGSRAVVVVAGSAGKTGHESSPVIPFADRLRNLPSTLPRPFGQLRLSSGP